MSCRSWRQLVGHRPLPHLRRRQTHAVCILDQSPRRTWPCLQSMETCLPLKSAAHLRGCSECPVSCMMSCWLVLYWLRSHSVLPGLRLQPVSCLVLLLASSWWSLSRSSAMAALLNDSHLVGHSSPTSLDSSPRPTPRCWMPKAALGLRSSCPMSVLREAAHSCLRTSPGFRPE